MNILIINRALGTLFGGGESFDLNVARYLQRRGHEVTLVTGKPLWGQPRNQYPGMHVVYLPCPELRRYAYATQRIHSKVSAAFYHLDNVLFEQAVYRWLRRQPKNTFDLAQLCSLFGLPRQLLAEFKLPCVSWLPGPPSRVVKKRIVSLLKSAHFGLFANSHFGLFARGISVGTLQAMGLVHGQDYAIIEPGIELALVDQVNEPGRGVRMMLGLNPVDRLGVTTARLVPVKNHRLLIQAIAHSNRRGTRWHWVMIGEGPLEAELRRVAQGLGVADQIHFLGYQPQEVVYRWLAEADLFAMTSRYESFSIATLEAMAHRLPVIGTRVGYLQHLIADAEAGLVVSPDDPVELVDALVRMTDLAVRSDYGKKGRAFAERLDWPLIAEKLERFYQQVVAGRFG